MAEAERAIAKQDKLIAALAATIADAKAQITSLASLGDQLEAAKKSMQTADDKVASEYQQNHDYRTNLGGASQGAVNAQAESQQNYAQLKRQAADAPDEIQVEQSHLNALTHERASAVQRRDRYSADFLADEKAISKADQDILAEEQVLLAKQQALSAGGAGAASSTAAAVPSGSNAPDAVKPHAP